MVLISQHMEFWYNQSYSIANGKGHILMDKL